MEPTLSEKLGWLSAPVREFTAFVSKFTQERDEPIGRPTRAELLSRRATPWPLPTAHRRRPPGPWVCRQKFLRTSLCHAPRFVPVAAAAVPGRAVVVKFIIKLTAGGRPSTQAGGGEREWRRERRGGRGYRWGTNFLVDISRGAGTRAQAGDTPLPPCQLAILPSYHLDELTNWAL